MNEKFATMLAVGGKSNSLGRVNEVLALVLADESRLPELYECMSNEDAWVRMRAADAFEKVCRQHSAWLKPFISRFPEELAVSEQPSIQWHLAQIYRQVALTEEQRSFAIQWLKRLLSRKEIDWIVAANAMDTLYKFYNDGYLSSVDLVPSLKMQQDHKSQAVVKRANKYLIGLSDT